VVENRKHKVRPEKLGSGTLLWDDQAPVKTITPESSESPGLGDTAFILYAMRSYCESAQTTSKTGEHAIRTVT
jgi:hypothetical protein